MSAEVLNVEARDSRGKRNAKRMRMAGKVPAVLYGHNKESVSLAIDSSEFSNALRHNARLVELKGSVT
ncbi:MAG: 50S ribosomal protein L25, partial [Planctomycetota bacterium]